MKLPKTVLIGGIQWDVVLTDKISDNGNTDYDKYQILIHKNIPQGAKEITLLHEVIHACRFVSGGDYTTKTKYTEEQFISHIEHSLYAFLKTVSFKGD